MSTQPSFDDGLDRLETLVQDYRDKILDQRDVP